MKLIDFPRFVPLEVYEHLKQKLIKHLSQFPEVKSVYQLGSVKEPGISDLDILVVFEENVKIEQTLIPELTQNEKYILTHSLFGVTKDKVNIALKYTYFTNFKLLFGEDLGIISSEQFEENSLFKTQISLEFLSVFYISLSKQIDIGIIKFRAFLLNVKGLKIDFELLGIRSEKIDFQINKFLSIRSEYFDKNFTDKYLIDLIVEFYFTLKQCFDELFELFPFYLPRVEFKISKNVKLIKNNQFKHNFSGLVLPNNLSFLGKKYINLQNKWLKFNFLIPFQIPEKQSIFELRFLELNQIYKQGKKDFNFCIPLSTGFNYFFDEL